MVEESKGSTPAQRAEWAKLARDHRTQEGHLWAQAVRDLLEDVRVRDERIAAALGMIDQTVYNADSLRADLPWRNDEVLAMLHSLRDAMSGGVPDAK